MLHGQFPIFGILLVFIIIAAVVKIFHLFGGRRLQDFPYEREQDLFSPAERLFLGVFEKALNGELHVMGKVRLADVVKVKSGMNKSEWRKAFNRIQSKHIDFVACDPLTFSVQFAVELDDKSHKNSQRQNRDEIVDKVLQAAGIPLYRFTAKRTYSIEDVRNKLFGTERNKQIESELIPAQTILPDG